MHKMAVPDHKPARLHLVSNPLKDHRGENSNIATGLQRQIQNTLGIKTHHSEIPMTFKEDGSTPLSSPPPQALPEFQKHKETTNIELFYDLFFVANLTTFSSVNEINDHKTLTSYIGFFCILWFTWCQVSLFDVRFVADSVLERMAKAVHLGVMTGFAVVGPNFVPTDTGEEANVFRTMSLILMISRFVLALQYLLVMWHVRKYRNTKLPFILIAGINFIAACIYLGVTFAFKDAKRSYAYRSFYVVAVVEIAGNIAVSSLWKVVTFKGTHLVQRMSLLTLIILGEGVMVVSKNIAKIVQNNNAWDVSTIGTVIAAITIIYLLYMLYFDALPEHHFGSIRQQIWTFIHFPFHLALVLFMEGMAQFIIWHKMVKVADLFLSKVNSMTIFEDITNQNIADLTETLNSTISSIFELYIPPNASTIAEVEETLTAISYGYTTSNKTSFLAKIDDLAATVVHSIFESYAFEPPELKAGSPTPSTPTEELDRDLSVIALVFVYFFVAAGITLILMGVLNFLTLRRECFTKKGLKHPGLIVRFSSYLVVGLGTALLAIMVNFSAGARLADSAWLLPTVTLAIIVVLLVQYLHLPGHEA